MPAAGTQLRPLQRRRPWKPRSARLAKLKLVALWPDCEQRRGLSPKLLSPLPLNLLAEQCKFLSQGWHRTLDLVSPSFDSRLAWAVAQGNSACG